MPRQRMGFWLGFGKHPRGFLTAAWSVHSKAGSKNPEFQIPNQCSRKISDIPQHGSRKTVTNFGTTIFRHVQRGRTPGCVDDLFLEGTKKSSGWDCSDTQIPHSFINTGEVEKSGSWKKLNTPYRCCEDRHLLETIQLTFESVLNKQGRMITTIPTWITFYSRWLLHDQLMELWTIKHMYGDPSHWFYSSRSVSNAFSLDIR